MEREQQPGSNSWLEEFDHLETLVTTLNDTVTSMAGLPHTEGSNTSIVINNSSALRRDNALAYGDSEVSYGDSGVYGNTPEMHKVELNSADLNSNYAVNATSGDECYHNSSSSFSSYKEASSHVPTTTGGVAGSELDNQGSDSSIVRENLAADGATYDIGTGIRIFENAPHSNVSSIEILVDREELDMGEEFRDVILEEGSEGPSVDEFDDNLVELLKFGDSADLHMV